MEDIRTIVRTLQLIYGEETITARFDSAPGQTDAIIFSMGGFHHVLVPLAQLTLQPVGELVAFIAREFETLRRGTEHE